jgi:flagellar M-ring protein FliF
VDKFLKQIATFLSGLSLRQRILIGVSAALVVGMIALFVRLSQSADFKPLYSGLSPTDAQAVVQSLIIKNIAYQISTDGTSISVPADQIDKTRLALAAEGMPQTGRLGFEIFDKPNWAGSDFSEQVNYQRALEGELERTIETLGNVQSVRVHLVLPHESLFTDRERSAKAAVVMKLRGGGLSDDETNAVTHLVASAVDNLSPENVTLIGADGRTPLVAKGRNGISGKDASVELEAGMAEKLVATLAPVVGPDRVKASVTVAYDQGSGDTTQEIYDPANAALVSSTIQEENFGGTPPAGIPGTTSNVPSAPAGGAQNNAQKPAAPPPAAATNAKPGALAANPTNPILSSSTDTEGQHSESRTYAVSKTLRHRIDPSGRIEKVAAAVIVDDVVEQTKDAKGKIQEIRRKRTPDEMKQIEALAQAAIGFDATRGDILTVQNVSFVNAPSESPEPLPITERVRVVTEKWIWLARYLMLFALFCLIYLLVLRPVKNQLLTSFQPAAQIGSHALAGALAGAGGSSGTIGGAGVALPQPGAAVSDIDLERELSETNSEVERVVKMKRHLVEKVKSEPGAASQLVRQWINEKDTY